MSLPESCHEVASFSTPESKVINHLDNEVRLMPAISTQSHPPTPQLSSSKSRSFNEWIGEFKKEQGSLSSASWADEFAYNQTWATEFHFGSPATDDAKLNGLFERFESLWKEKSEVDAWKREFLQMEGILHSQEGDIDPEFEKFEQIWNSKPDNHTNINPLSLTSKYVFETENPYLDDQNAYDKAVEIFSSPNGSLTDASLAFEAAIQMMRENPQCDKKNLSNAWYLLGNCQAENEKENAALIAYEESLALDPDNPACLLALAVSLTNESLDEKLVNILSRWASIVLGPVGTIATNNRELLLERLSEGVKQCETFSPSFTELYIALGLLYYCSGEFDRSIHSFQTALKAVPNDYLLWNRLGATLANSQQSEKAISMYERALQLKPSFIRAKHNLGVSCMNIGCYSEAAEYLVQALKSQHSLRHLHPSKVKNPSTNLWETLRRTFIFGDHLDLAVLCENRELEKIIDRLNTSIEWNKPDDYFYDE